MDSETQEIKEKLPINEVVGQYVQLRRAGRNYTARCPFHKEKTPSFHVSPERNSYMCFGCGEKGDIFSFVQKIEGVDFLTALKQLAERAGVELKQRAPSHSPEEKDKEARLLEVCEAATVFFESTLKSKKEVVEYLHARGVHDDTITTWRLGYAPASWEDLSNHLKGKGFSKDDIVDAGLAARSEKKQGEIYDRFRGRVMFPIFDPAGKVIAFSGRYFEKVHGSKEEGEPAKYVNSPETQLFKKSKTLYGFHIAKQQVRTMKEKACFLLVEGQFDVVMSHQSGYPIAVAISGTALTNEHLSLLGRFSKNLILALDADSAGLRAGLRSTLMATFAEFDVKIPIFPQGKDPADLAKENPSLLKMAISTAKPAVEYFTEAFRSLAKDERQHKQLVQQQVLPIIASMSSKIEQAHFASVISQRIDVPVSSVLSDIAKVPNVKRDYVPDISIENQVNPTSVLLVPKEKAAAMLLAMHKNKEEVIQKLTELLGKGRTDELAKKAEPEEEKLRFEFESLGEDAAKLTEALLLTIERGVLEDEMRTLKSKMASADQVVAKEATNRLLFLKRREQELRR